MAGIYIHIPFCKKKCHYCDFYKTLETNLSGEFVDSLVKEINIRKDYISPDEIIETLYFGGGTPSVLSIIEFRKVMRTIRKSFNFSDNPEITVEINPDDATKAFIGSLVHEGVNRLSIGIQSWDDGILSMLNRRHNARQAEQSILIAREAGIKNISVDLIYGIPGLSSEDWKSNLEKTFEMGVEHISAYHLTIEKNTMFGKMKDLGQFEEIAEESSEEQFGILTDMVKDNNYLHYEISNISKEEYISRHNTNYWRQVNYLGLGPSAHSYNGYSREWNISDLKEYTESLQRGESPSEREELDEKTRYNEYVMTSLRTMWGIDLNYIENSFNKEMHDYLVNISARFIKYGMLLLTEENNLVLTDQGKMISDNITTELIMS